jgi:branched-chain amino acid transport system permease protein
MSGLTVRQLGAAAAFAAVLAAVPLAADSFQLSVLTLIFLYAYVGIAWNVMMGFAGQLSLGHALFFGVGAYTVGVLVERFGVTPWLGFPLAIALSAAAAVVVGALGFRFAVRGVYFALLTIALAELTRILFEHWEFVGKTGGIFLRALGPDNHPLATLRGGAVFFYYALLITLLFGWGLSALLLRSRVGYFWRSIREDEDAARAIGVPAFRMKVLAAAISGGLTGLGGGWFALLGGSLFPDSVLGMRTSIDLIIAPIVGGLGTVFGPILGALVVVPLNEFAKEIAQDYGVNGLNFVVYGVLLMAIILGAPGGLWPRIAHWFRLAGRP